MTYPHALALFAVMSVPEQESIVFVFDGIKSAFKDPREAFVQAVEDEAMALDTEMMLQRVEMQ